MSDQEKKYVKLVINDEAGIIQIKEADTLQAIRKQASSFLGMFDLFLMDGAMVNKANEAKITAKEVWIAPPTLAETKNTKASQLYSIKLKRPRPSSKKHDFSTIDTSNKAKIIKPDGLPEPIEDRVSKEVKLSSEVSLDTIPSMKDYFVLSTTDKYKFTVEYNQLDHGLIIDGHNFQKSMLKLVEKPQFHVLAPQKTIEYHTLATFNKRQRDTVNATGYAGSIKAVTPYVSGGIEASKSASKQELKDKQELYVVSFCKIPKLHLLIDKADLKLNSSFKESISNIVKDVSSEKTDKAFYNEKLIQLIKVLDKYGYYFPLSFRLGGSLKTTKTMTKEQATTISAAEDAVSGSLSASVGGYGGEVSLSYKKESQDKKTSASQRLDLSIEAIGGDPAFVNDQNLFARSLNQAIGTWAVIDYRTLFPSIGLLNPSLASKCARIISQSDKELNPDINKQSYISPIKNLVTDGID